MTDDHPMIEAPEATPLDDDSLDGAGETTYPKDDILDGVAAIAAYIGESKRKTYYKAEHGHIPAHKVGAKWRSSRSAINADEERRQAEALERCQKKRSAT
jgi:excisionase family DNA binding protein